MNYILGFFTFIQFLMKLWGLVNGLIKESNEAAARAKRERLNAALDKLEKAVTDDDRQKAIKEIAENSF